MALIRLETLNLRCKTGVKFLFDTSIAIELERALTSVKNNHTQDICSIARDDMLMAEKGGVWPLSSYSPGFRLASLPGFEDYSMEEERFRYYEAKKNGELEEYKRKFRILLREAQMRFEALKNPSPETVQFLRIFYSK